MLQKKADSWFQLNVMFNSDKISNCKFAQLHISINKALGSISEYDIVISRNFSGLSAKIADIGLAGKKVCIICDANIKNFYIHEVKKSLIGASCKVYTHIIQPGEKNKIFASVEKIYKTLVYNNFERSDFIAALGGGVTGDISGFAAATYMRGIRFIQLPTTLLSMVDSSIGGKTGVDFLSFKNLIGAFHMPALVYTNIETLNTLDRRNFLSGMGEVIKHALIKSNRYYNFIENNVDNIIKKDFETLLNLVYISNTIKKSIVEKDPDEKSCRAFLNLGHTIGHALERESVITASDETALLHGECVGLGCISALYLSNLYSLRLNENSHSRHLLDIARLKRILKSFFLPIKFKGIDINDILTSCLKDKKNSEGRVGFVLLKNIGSPFLCHDISYDEMKGAIETIYDYNEK